CSSIHRNSVRARLRRVQERFPVSPAAISVVARKPDPAHRTRIISEDVKPWSRRESPWDWLEDEVLAMGEQVQEGFRPARMMVAPLDPELRSFLEREQRREEKERQKREELLERIRAGEQRQREEQLRRQQERQARAAAQAQEKATAAAAEPAKALAPLPEV